MAFENMLGSKLVQIETKKTAKKSIAKVGCEHCSLNERKDLNKIFPKIRGRKLFIYGMCPGREENEEKDVFVGKAGQFLWKELRKVGIKRKHVDVSNVVRCYSSDYVDKRQMMRNPNAAEIKCCSIHTENELAKSKAKIYLILGSVAAKAILGKEWRAGTKILWSDKLQAKVYCLYHPSYFTRRGVPLDKPMKEWRQMLAELSQELKSDKKLSQYGYIAELDYKAIRDASAAIREAKKIKAICRKHKIRLSIDLEDDTIDGVKQPLVIGTCYKKGRSRVFYCGDWDVTEEGAKNFRPNKKIIAVLKDLLEDPSFEKVCHHGSYDIPKIKELLDIKVAKYTFDTEYATYLYSNATSIIKRRSYGLDVIGLEYFPKFGEYKTIILPEALPVGFNFKEHGLAKNTTLTQLHDFISARGMMRLAQLPEEKMVLYNGADCDLTKHLEVMTKNHISLPLLRVYVDAAFTVDEMTPNGPVFDYEHLKLLRKVFPPRLKKLTKKLRKIAGKPDFNPGSPDQIAWLLVKKLHILEGEEIVKKNGNVKIKCVRGTSKGILEELAPKHPEAKIILEYRRVKRIVSTYLDSYEECANVNGGRVRTKWWLTGTQTGRMSSGGGKVKKKGETKVINLQNVINDPLCQNLCVPDKKWRKLFKAMLKMVVRCLGSDKELRSIAKQVALLSEEKDKEKKSALEKKMYARIDELKKKIQETSKFARLVKELVKKYGEIHVELGFDEGQIEVRIAAQLSGDKQLIKDCIEGDIHSRVGHAITGWAIEKIKKDKATRTFTKNVHFGILFGLDENNVYAFVIRKDPNAKITEEEVIKGVRNYFKRYPKVKVMVRTLREFVQKNGYVENMFGFRRKLEVNPQNNWGGNDEDESGAEGGAYWGNQAINTPVQGAAHHLMFMAMAMLHRDPKKVQKNLIGVPGMEVHDFMGWWTKLKNLDKAYKAGKYLLAEAPLEVVKKDFPHIKWLVPLEVEGKVGLRHGDVVEAEGLTLPQMLLEMFFATWLSEEKLKLEIAKEAA